MNKSNATLYTILVVIILIIIGLLVFTPKKAMNKDSGSFITSGTPDQQKAQILSRVNDSKPLTVDEKKMIFQTLSGDQVQKYHFTEQEKLQIIKALNR